MRSGEEQSVENTSIGRQTLKNALSSLRNSAIDKNIWLLVIIPAFSFCIIRLLFASHDVFLTLLSDQNFVYLAAALSVLLFAFMKREKDIFDWLIILILLHMTAAGPLKALFYNYIYYDMSRLFFTGLLLLFVGVLINRIIQVPRWVFPSLFASLLVILTASIMIIEIQPVSWLFREENGHVIFHFFSSSHIVNNFLQTLAILVPSLIVIYAIFIRDRSVNSLQPRTLLQFAGVFFLVIILQMKTFFVYMDYRSAWLHSLFGLLGFIPLFMWFIAFRIQDRELRTDNWQFMSAVHLSFLVPLVYFFVSHLELRAFLIIFTILVLLEIILLLFIGLITLRTEVTRLGQRLRDMGEYLSRLWSREEESFIITTRDGEMVAASNSLKELAGEAIQGRYIHDMVRDEQSRSPGVDISTHLGTAWLKSVDGVHHPITIHSRIFNGGHESLTLNVIRDQQRYEQKQKLNQRMQEKMLQLKKMESLIEMSGEIAHNFNNFLNGINAYSEMIRMHIDNADYPRADTYLPGLFQELARAAEYVRKVIDVTNVDTPHIGQVSLKQAIDEALSLVLRVVDRERYSFTIDIPASCLYVMAGIEDLTEIFFQLIWNAVESMPDGGTITIQAALFPVDRIIGQADDFSPPMLQVSISDTGIGIAPETKDQIFDPFFSTKSNVGKGLGLTITYALVKRYKGTVSWSNNPFKGVTFTVALPAVQDYSLSPGTIGSVT